MKKAIVTFGYSDYVLDVDKAIELVEILETAELYDEQLQATGETHFHIYEQNTRDLIRKMKIIPPEFYRIAKLAGIPENKRRD
jgi:hypothetical protein